MGRKMRPIDRLVEYQYRAGRFPRGDQMSAQARAALAELGERGSYRRPDPVAMDMKLAARATAVWEVVKRKPGLTVAQIAQEADADPKYASSVLNRLLKEGHVKYEVGFKLARHWSATREAQ